MAVDGDPRVDFVVSAESVEDLGAGGEPPPGPGPGRRATVIGAIAAVLVIAIVINHVRGSSVGPAPDRPSPSVAASTTPHRIALPVPSFGPVALHGLAAPTHLIGSGDRVWGVADSGTVVALTGGRVVATGKVTGYVTATAASSSGNALFIATVPTAAATGDTGGQIVELDATTLRSLGSVGFTGRIDSFAVSGNTVWVASQGAVITLDPGAARPMVETTVGPPTTRIRSMTYLPTSGDLIALAVTAKSTQIVQVDPIGHTVLRGITVPGTDGAVATSAFGTTVWYAGRHAPVGARQVVKLRTQDLAEQGRVSVPGDTATVFSGEQSWWSLDPTNGRASCHDPTDGQAVDGTVWPHADPATAALLADGTGVYLSSSKGLSYEPVPPDC